MVGKFCGFCGSISNCESFLVNYSLILHAAEVFHLKQFAMHGISFMFTYHKLQMVWLLKFDEFAI